MAKFSKDPIVQLCSIKEFMKMCNYLYLVGNENLWDDKKTPKIFKTFYKFTENKLIRIEFGLRFGGFGFKEGPKLEKIFVAYRDGKTEYEVINERLENMKKEKNEQKLVEYNDFQIRVIEKNIKLLPGYHPPTVPQKRPYESYLVDTGYKTSKERLKNKYLVFDVETNGLRKAKDDLLSLSIYDPTSGKSYNRFFPLDLQPLVLTTYINGIDDIMLENECHMDQEEMNWLIDYFNMKDKILLSYSGGKGTFDPSFVSNYCKRHKINGFDELKFENIKSMLPQAPYGSEGELTKDNFCKLLKIEGVKDIHSSYNDCILEWKLFENVDGECLFFTDTDLFKYKPSYIIPVSYLMRYPILAEYAQISIPNLEIKETELFKYEFPKKFIDGIKKFPTNITGISIEHGINTLLNAKEQDNIEFLIKNKRNLEYIGTIKSSIEEIPITPATDGTIKAVNDKDKEFVEEVNETTINVVEHLEPLVNYLKQNIFKSGEIKTQELVISTDNKVMALCDLSDENSVVEIKTFNPFKERPAYSPMFLSPYQLYYQANGRKTYLLSIDFEREFSFGGNVKSLTISLYKIDLIEFNPAEIIKTYELKKNDIEILKCLIKNPFITKTELSYKTGISTGFLNMRMNFLEKLGYINKEDLVKRNSKWEVLRSVDDKITKYKEDNKKIIIVE